MWGKIFWVRNCLTINLSKIKEVADICHLFWNKRHFTKRILFQYFNSPILTGQNCGSYGLKAWRLGGVTLWVTGGKCGSGNCWLGRYTLYYIYVGDINILYKISRVNPPRKIHHVLETCHGASLRWEYTYRVYLLYICREYIIVRYL